MPATRTVQSDIMAHKQRMGFNTTDPAEDMRLLRGEVDELQDAITAGDTAHVGQELADVGIYMSGGRAARTSGSPDHPAISCRDWELSAA